MLSFLKKKEAKPNVAQATKVDLSHLRIDFPILNNQKKPLIYMDNACVTLRPQAVIDAITSYYTKYSACAGRSSHRLSRELDMAILAARDEISQFIGAKHPDEIIFTKNTTESINLVANALSIKEGDLILTSHMEHNSNLIPWQKLVKQNDAVLKIIPPNIDGDFSVDNLQKELDTAKKHGQHVAIISLHHLSNVDGTSIDIAEVVKRARWYNAKVLVDGAQAIGHIPVNVKDLGVDFYAFSAHKMCGPSGMGALYASRDAQKHLDQFIVGGQTVLRSSYTSHEPLSGPSKFEAGLQDYAGILGFAAACVYLRKAGLKNIEEHSLKLNTLLTDLLSDEIKNKKIELLGNHDPKKRGSIFSFIVSTMPQTEFASMLDKTYGIAVRSGQHCVHSWFNAVNKEGSVRISLHLYNSEDEIRQVASSIKALLSLHGD